MKAEVTERRHFEMRKGHVLNNVRFRTSLIQCQEPFMEMKRAKMGRESRRLRDSLQKVGLSELRGLKQVHKLCTVEAPKKNYQPPVPGRITVKFANAQLRGEILVGIGLV